MSLFDLVYRFFAGLFTFYAVEAPERPSSHDLFQRAAEAGDKLRELRQMPADKRGDTYEADRRAASTEVVDLDREFTEARNREQYELELLAFERGMALPEARGGEAAGADVSRGEQRTAGEVVIGTDDHLKELRTRGEEGGIEVRNLLDSGGAHGSGSSAFVPVGTPFLAPQGVQQRRLFVRDLMTVQQTGLSMVPYIQEVSAATNETGATTVSEGSAKPEVTMQFTTAEAPLRKIAAWIQVTTEAMEDAPTLMGYINNRLAYMVLLEEEEQVLAGDGTAPNISGITDQPNKQTTGATNNDAFQDFGDAIGKVELKDGSADGIAMNAGDFWTLITERRSTTFDGAGFGPPNAGGAPFSVPGPGIWDLPVVRTRSLATLTAIVGAWRLGATIFEKGGTRIKSTDSHASLFTSNTEVVLAEKRTGLAVHRPDWFVVCTIDLTA